MAQPLFSQHSEDTPLVAATPLPVEIAGDARSIHVSNRGILDEDDQPVDGGDIWFNVNGEPVTGAGQAGSSWLPFGATVEVDSANPGSDDVVNLWSAGTPSYSVEGWRP